MPDDSKKTSKKSNRHDKHEPKDQRKPRQSRPNTAPPAIPEKTEVKKDKLHENNVPQEPGPEFYKGLKRETDEILKITEESNAKYNSKKIQSNWKKYEMPIDSYDEIEEQENMGADYEKLIQAPMSIGGHFQFKHEKSWDSVTGPSEYDKYFDIYSGNLGTAIYTIPFYERNNLDQSMFSEIDMSGMRNRAIKYKQKYYNDKTYTTPDMEVLEKIVILCNAASEHNNMDDTSSEKLDINLDEIPIKGDNKESFIENGINEQQLSSGIEDINIVAHANPILEEKETIPDEIDDILETSEVNIIQDIANVAKTKDDLPVRKVETNQPVVKETKSKAADPEEAKKPVIKSPEEAKKKPVIESPEDLEKWLDDFLDS